MNNGTGRLETRTRSGEFSLAQAIQIAAVQEPGRVFDSALIPMNGLLKKAADAAKWAVNFIRAHPYSRSWLLRIVSPKAPEIVKELEEDILENRHSEVNQIRRSIKGERQ